MLLLKMLEVIVHNGAHFVNVHMLDFDRKLLYEIPYFGFWIFAEIDNGNILS